MSVLTDSSDLTVPQAAEFLGIPGSFVDRLLTSGKLSCRLVSGRRCISRSDLLSYKRSFDCSNLVLDDIVSKSESLGLYDIDVDSDRS